MTTALSQAPLLTQSDGTGPVRAVIILNERAGGASVGDLRARLEAACAQHRIAARIVACGGASIVEQARAATMDRPTPDVIVAAGGDGTISGVAGAILDSGIALGVLPLGTLNHFAKDLGVPLDLDEAVGVLAARTTRRIDAGEVNGRLFLNNSVIGLYPALVTDRDRQRAHLGRAKWLAHILAAVKVAFHFPILRLRLSVDGAEQRIRTPLVFIGNNEYRTGLSGLFSREALDGGHLVVHIVRRQHWWGVLGLLVRLMLGMADRRALETHRVTHLAIHARRRRLRVAFDGEVAKVQTPLIYRILPLAITVAVPAA